MPLRHDRLQSLWHGMKRLNVTHQIHAMTRHGKSEMSVVFSVAFLAEGDRWELLLDPQLLRQPA